MRRGGEGRGEGRGGEKERVGRIGVGRRGWERGGEGRRWEGRIVGLVREELNWGRWFVG